MWPQGFGYVVERWCRRDACSNEDGTREVGYGGYGVGHLSPCHAHCLAPWSQSGLPLRARIALDGPAPTVQLGLGPECSPARMSSWLPRVRWTAGHIDP